MQQMSTASKGQTTAQVMSTTGSKQMSATTGKMDEYVAFDQTMPRFLTTAELIETQKTQLGLAEDTPLYLNPATETLQRTMPWGEEDTNRWSQELPVLTTSFDIAAPGAYRLEKDSTGRICYSPVKARRAPLAEAEPTKRAEPIAKHIDGLNDEMTALEASTRIRNEELHKHLDAIATRVQNWEAKLQVEVVERDKASAFLGTHFDEILATASKEEESNLMSVMEGFHGDGIPQQFARQSKLEEDVTEFVDVTVPTVIDRLTGEVKRKLQKAHDTFDIENAKILKREQKITQRFAVHIQKSAQAFEDERATRKAKLTVLSEDCFEAERQDDRAEERHTSACHHSILDVKKELAEEVGVREREDNTLLDSMIYSQSKLQQSVLTAFGAEAAGRE